MARTGSGKTAAFLVPLLQKLKSHSLTVGARAVVFSPTRELALQTAKFTRDIGIAFLGLLLLLSSAPLVSLLTFLLRRTQHRPKDLPLGWWR